jgi:hypothetical protein
VLERVGRRRVGLGAISGASWRIKFAIGVEKNVVFVKMTLQIVTRLRSAAIPEFIE